MIKLATSTCGYAPSYYHMAISSWRFLCALMAEGVADFEGECVGMDGKSNAAVLACSSFAAHSKK